METTMTQEQKIQLLSKDFLDRDAGTLVASRQSGRLGWESTIRSGGAYSEFILHPKSDEDLIRNAYRLASEMLSVMDTPAKVNVKITPDNSCTDSNTVWVATRVFDDADMTVGKKLDTFIGLAVHEGCHLLYTDFKGGIAADNSTVRALQNIIEDERIERECGQSRPGLSNFLAASKYYYFDKYRQDLLEQGRLESLDTPKRLMNAILSYIRYPKALEQSDIKEFCDVLLTVREVLTPYPSSTAESLETARKIYDAMKQSLQDEQKQQQSSSESKNQSSKPEGQNKDAASGQGCTPSSDSGSDGQYGGDSLDNSIAEMDSAIRNLVKESGEQGLSDNEISETVKQDNGKVGQVCEGRLERGSQRDTYIEKAEESRDIYEQSLSRVRQYVPAISKSLRCLSSEYHLSLRGMRSGTLDTSKLAEAVQGVPTVYVREGEVKSDKVAVCILLDESGSMWGSGELAARDTAVLLNEAFGGIPNIDLYIYGHTASRKTTSLFVYREKGFRNRYTLGSTSSRAGNHDSIAIREAATRIRRFTKEHCLFFVVSDGAPNESPELVKKSVQDISKDGFKVVAVSIDPYYDPATMYENNVVFTDLPSLAISLGKMIKTTLEKKLKKTCV